MGCSRRPPVALFWILCSVLGGLSAREADAQAVVSGNAVTVSANATDNVGVVGVRFYLDGTPLGAEDRSPPYTISWDSTAWPDGAYTLTAEARDAAGNRGTSAPVPVIVDNSAAPDTAPPTGVSLTSPVSGASVSGVITLAGTATDDVRVAVVRFFVDGVLVGSDGSPPYRVTWDTSSVPDGARTIVLRAEDAAGNTTTSSAVAVTVVNSATLPPPPPPDTTSPTVRLTGPASGAVVAGAVVVSAFASDDTGVAGVQFLVDGVMLGGEDTAPPYRVTWNTATVPDGAHTLTARARDLAGNLALSAPVAVTVRNPAEPEPNPDPGPETAAMGDGVVRLSIAPSSTGFREIRARTDGGDRMELYIDGERVADASGRSLTYQWDVRGLMGGREVRVVTLEGAGIVSSTSLFYQAASTETSVARLEVVTLPIIGATYIRAHADVPDPFRMELYIDGELRLAQADPDFEYAWAPEPGRAYEIVFATYDDSGLVASIQVGHIP